MPYNEKLADRMREKLMALKPLAEIKMMGGLCFMYKTKMCCGIVKDDLMVRVTDDRYEEALAHPYCRPMDFTGKPLKHFVFVSMDGIRKDKDLAFWLEMGIEFVDALPPEKLKKSKAKSLNKKSKASTVKKVPVKSKIKKKIAAKRKKK